MAQHPRARINAWLVEMYRPKEKTMGALYISHIAGRDVITQADEHVKISLETLSWNWPVTKVVGDEIEILGQVVYRATGYDDGSLIAELIEDRRPQ